MTEVEKQVWDIVKSLNRAWTVDGDAGALGGFFHKDMVAITATDRLRIEGADACVASWMAFVEKTKILRWEESDPKIQVYGDGRFAVVTYYFDMAFEMGGRVIDLGGRDMFVLVKEGGKWLAVADQFSPYPG